MELDERVSERLKNEFDNRLRLRWSHQENCWHLEQQFNKGFHISRRGSEDSESDEMIRAREGYLQIMAIQNGDRMPCPRCKRQVPVPVNEMANVNCACGNKMIVGYYDLNSEALFEHLRKMDPLKDHRNALREKIAATNAKVWEEAQNKPSKLAEEYVTQAMSVKDFGIDMVGHTGKERMWEDAPKHKV